MSFSIDINTLSTVAGNIHAVSTKTGFKDFMGAVRVRWGIKRNNYRVNPGLYAVGNPNNTSDVFVSANYKLSFDILRKNMDGIDAWILVLDTKGINVWCAAGKGTFGTGKLVERIKQTELELIVNHRKVIVPQLGAPGISAHTVYKKSGFRVVYGPVRASDIKSFLQNRYKTSEEMRRVGFNFYDRIKLIPNDLMYGFKTKYWVFLLFMSLSLINREGFSPEMVSENILKIMTNVFGGYIAGIVLMPAFLPFIPFSYFSLKGFISGLIVFIFLTFMNITGIHTIEKISWFLIILSISSYAAMNFTGSSTFTSVSGVKKEIKVFLPVHILMIFTGVTTYIISVFI